VTFQDSNGIVLGSANIIGNAATFPTTNLIYGVHHMTAVYNGDSAYSPMTSADTDVAINYNPTTTAIVDNGPNPSGVGVNVQFTVTVTGVCSWTATCPTPPAGTVALKDSGTIIAAQALPAASGCTGNACVVTFNIANLASGTHSITAVYPCSYNATYCAGYGGDTNFSGSVSNIVSQTVQTSTTTTLATSGSPSTVGSTVTFTATVTAASGTPTGQVVFKDYATVLGTVTLNAGKAQLPVSNLSGGPLPNGMTHEITATYLGLGSTPPGNDLSSVSATLPQVVDLNATSFTSFTCSPDPLTSGSNLTCNGAINIPAAVTIYFATGPTGLCGNQTCTTAVASVVTTATGSFTGVQFPLTIKGYYGVYAFFMGNSTYESAETSVNQTVD
jgi:hypothetical protein